jgi:hypothetical protein
MGRKMSEATGDDDRAPSSPGLLCRRAGELQMGLMVFAELLRQRGKKNRVFLGIQVDIGWGEKTINPNPVQLDVLISLIKD